MRSASIPSLLRFSLADGSVVNSASLIRSVSIRLISSGMGRSRLRSPASTWATGIPSFTATSAAASVEFTSPTVNTQSGWVRSSSGSSAIMIRPVCMECDAEPIPRFTSGRGSSRSSRKSFDRELSWCCPVWMSRCSAALARSKARSTGAVFMKSGREPTTCTILISVPFLCSLSRVNGLPRLDSSIPAPGTRLRYAEGARPTDRRPVARARSRCAAGRRHPLWPKSNIFAVRPSCPAAACRPGDRS